MAKTLAIKTLSQLVDARYSRIQFTPDLLPADVIGTQIYSQKDEAFHVKKGPVFANFVLADEINRAPAKVQSALLEAMQEHQVTIGDSTFTLPDPFLVLATQNPIEQEGTYMLPEAQVDRFMLKVVIDYPTLEEEKLVIRENLQERMPVVHPVITANEILEARRVVKDVYIDDKSCNILLISFCDTLPRALSIARIEANDNIWWKSTCKYQSCKSKSCLCFHQASWLCCP